uniref:Uncharacterized protein n=1 Tax=Sphaerodactylus townsendi TaxID=933632 RepID=A0ACB8FT39_9SAUR
MTWLGLPSAALGVFGELHGRQGLLQGFFSWVPSSPQGCFILATMPPTGAPQWLQMNLSYRSTSMASTCISFFLLTISLFSPSWTKVIAPETNESSSPAGEACNKLVCDRPNEDNGTLGYGSMALYTVGVSWKDMTSIGHMHFTWSFCLAWLVFSLYFMNGFFSLVTHILYPVVGVGWHRNQILEGRVQELSAGDNMAVGAPPVLPYQEDSTNSEVNAFPVPSICINSTIL